MTYEAVHGSIHLSLKVTTFALAELDRIFNEPLVSRLVCCGKNERRVRRRILGLVDIDRCARG